MAAYACAQMVGDERKESHGEIPKARLDYRAARGSMSHSGINSLVMRSNSVAFGVAPPRDSILSWVAGKETMFLDGT